MRISDWSSDVCSSDLSGAMATPKITGMIRRKARRDAKGGVPAVGDLRQRRVERFAPTRDDLRQRIGEVAVDRKRVVWGKGGSVRVELGGRLIDKNKIHENIYHKKSQLT